MKIEYSICLFNNAGQNVYIIFLSFSFLKHTGWQVFSQQSLFDSYILFDVFVPKRRIVRFSSYKSYLPFAKYALIRPYSACQFPSSCARQHNDQAHPPPEAGATGGTTKAQAVGGRVQRLVSLLLINFRAICWSELKRAAVLWSRTLLEASQ